MLVWLTFSAFLGNHAGLAVQTIVFSASGESGELKDSREVKASETYQPPCAEACNDYQQGVDETSRTVCIDEYGTCAASGCGLGQCLQRFHGECSEWCSEWTDATHATLNVCQDQTDTFKCSGEKNCGASKSRCKQKKIVDCDYTCSAYEFSGALSVDQNSELVCQNIDPQSENMGICMPLPCSMAMHTSANYAVSKVCRQIYDNCGNSCAEGSEEPNATDGTTCFDTFSEVCSNYEGCPTHLSRCMAQKVHYDLSKVDKTSQDSWGLAEKTAEKVHSTTPLPLIRRGS